MREPPPDIENRLNLLFDDDEFERLDARLADFNIFDAIGGVRAELRHSNFLAFLFSPSRSHGLGSLILKKTLRTILENAPPGIISIRPLKLAMADIDDAIVHRERDNIDILIEINSLELVVLIENKVGAQAYPGQLERYKQYVISRFPKHKHMLVFLTPNGENPHCSGYIPLSYKQIAYTIESILNRNQTSSEQSLILSHYIEMLRRHIVPNDELKALAVRLYERHKEAFDFVFDARPQPLTLLETLKNRIIETDGLVEDKSIQSIIRFAPTCWDEILKEIKCNDTSWTPTKRGLLFEIKMNSDNGRVGVSLVIGPIDVIMKHNIHKFALERKKIFKGISKTIGEKYCTIYSHEILSPAVAQSLDFEQQCTAAGLGWSEFQASELPRVIEAINEIAVHLESPGTKEFSSKSYLTGE